MMNNSNYNSDSNMINNSIILSSCLFGSVYIFSKSFESMNRSFLENKKIPNKLIIVNGLICIISGSVFLCGVSLTSKILKGINNK